jgi:hypothetical protein
MSRRPTCVLISPPRPPREFDLQVSIEAALADQKLLGAALGNPRSWATWIAVLVAAFGGGLNPDQRRAFSAVAGERNPPEAKIRELWAIVGRRGGKSRIAAALAAFIATCVDHSEKLSPGEPGVVLVLAPSRSQAAVVLGYVRAFLQSSPILSQLIADDTAEEIRLTNGVIIAVHANNFRTVRSRTLIACIFDEAAYWRDESTALPDIEVYRAVLPALATTAGMLVGISSPYRKVGLLFQKFRDHFGQDSADVLVVRGSTQQFNPSIDATIERARQSDPAAALSEWDAEFRADLAQFLDDDSINAAIDHGRGLELPPQAGIAYHCFVDASAGRHDAFCVGVAHRDGERIVVDVIRGRRPPFDPASVAAEFAALARAYRCGMVTGDAYAGEWVSQAFKASGVEYRRAAHPKSVLYLEGLPAFTRGAVSIANHTALVRELRLLERRVARSGRDSVDHGPAGSDDFANVLFGCLWLCRTRPQVNIPELSAIQIPTHSAVDAPHLWSGDSGGGFSGSGGPFPW